MTDMKITIKHTLKPLFLAASLALVAVPAAAQDRPDVPGSAAFAPADVAQVKLLLSGYHDLAEQKAFEQVPGGPAIVQRLANGPNGLLRDRALAALGKYWPSADTYLLYATVVADPSTPYGTRHRALVMLGEVFGQRAVPAIAPYLTSEDVQTRITALQALAATDSDDAWELIERHAAQEKSAVVLDSLQGVARMIR